MPGGAKSEPQHLNRPFSVEKKIRKSENQTIRQKTRKQKLD